MQSPPSSLSSSSSTSQDSPSTAEHSFNDWTVHEVLRCKICNDYFDVPKLAPNCGHVFCLRCASSAVDTEHQMFLCPVCLVSSPFGPNGLEDWMTCTWFAELIRKSKEPPQTVDKVEEQDGVCPHVFFRESECKHCLAKFCNTCFVLHLEKIRCEIMSMASNLKKRFAAKTAELEKTVGDPKTLLVNEQLQMQEEVMQGFTLLREQLKWECEQREQLLLESVEKVIDKKMSTVEAALEKAQVTAKANEEIVANVSSKSVDDFSIEELGEMFASVSNNYEDIDTASRLTKEDVYGKVVFEKKRVTKAILTAIDESVNVDSCCKVLDIVEFEHAEAFKNATWQLHEASKQGNFELVGKILESSEWSSEEKEKFLNHGDDTHHSRTLLHQACGSGCLELVKYLVEKWHCKLDVRDTGNTIPLFLAAFRGDVDIVRVLLPALEKENPNESYDFATDALRFAIVHGHAKVVDFMISHNRQLLDYKNEFRENFGETWLHLAVMKNQMAVVVCLVKNGIDVSAQDMTGNTALHYACQNGSLEIARYLLDYLVDANPTSIYARNRDDETAFDLATSRKHKSIISILQDKIGQSCQGKFEVVPDEMLDY